MATLEDEVTAMRSLERALAKVEALGGKARLRALYWGRDRVGELISDTPMEPENVPPPKQAEAPTG